MAFSAATGADILTDEGSFAGQSLSRLGLVHLMEAGGEPLPVMFGSYHLLERWCLKKGVGRPKAIRGVSLARAVKISGFYEFEDGTCAGHDQVWARATYTRYRRALIISHAQDFYSLDEAGSLYSQANRRIIQKVRADYSAIDADHVINRASLSSLPEAWVMLFPISKKVNRSFGALEKLFPAAAPGVDVIPIPPIVVLKLFIERLPLTPRELEEEMERVRRHMLHKNPFARSFCDEMQLHMRDLLDASGT